MEQNFRQEFGSLDTWVTPLRVCLSCLRVRPVGKSSGQEGVKGQPAGRTRKGWEGRRQRNPVSEGRGLVGWTGLSLPWTC